MGTENSFQHPADQEHLEASLLRTLANGSVSDDLARELVSEISSIESLQVNPIRPFPKGVLTIDGIGVEVVLDKAGVRDLSQVLLDARHVDSIEIFPYGIIDPNIFIGRVGFRF